MDQQPAWCAQKSIIVLDHGTLVALLLFFPAGVLISAIARGPSRKPECSVLGACLGGKRHRPSPVTSALGVLLPMNQNARMCFRPCAVIGRKGTLTSSTLLLCGVSLVSDLDARC
jgi:hypothetical protein